VSKLFVLLLLSAVLVSSCEKNQKIDYIAPDVAEKLTEIGNQEKLSTPQTASTSVQLMYELKIDQAMKSMMALVQPEMIKVAMTVDVDFDHELATFYQGITSEELDKLMPELIEDFALLYEKYFTEEELQTWLKFSQSTVGQKMVSTRTAIMADSVSIGQKLEADLLKGILDRTDEYKENESNSDE
jgi:hypothetical protein